MILRILKSKWWKLVGLILLLFVFVSGLLIPLSPGIKSINQDLSKNRFQKIIITGYNTHFSESDSENKVWLKIRNAFICAESAVADDNNLLTAVFDTQKADTFFFNQISDLVVNNNKDGTLILRAAVKLKKPDLSDSMKHQIGCDLTVMHDKLNTVHFPNRALLYESIRNLFFHVPMWFTMVLLLFFSVICSILYLSGSNLLNDKLASNAVHVAILFGFLGLVTGMLWANFTWGAPWPNDPRLNGAAVGMLVYLAYVILRGSFTDEIKRAKISAVYNIFAFSIYIIFIFILPRMTASLHPGVGGNPAFSEYDLDSTLRMVFYPAVIGWMILGFWIFSLKLRITLLLEHNLFK